MTLSSAIFHQEGYSSIWQRMLVCHRIKRKELAIRYQHPIAAFADGHIFEQLHDIVWIDIEYDCAQ